MLAIFEKIKNYILIALCVLFLLSCGYAYFKGKQVEARDQTIVTQTAEIKAKVAEIQAQKEQIAVMETNMDNIKTAQQAMQKVQSVNKKLKVQIIKLSGVKDNGQEAQVYRDMFDFFVSSGVSGDVSNSKTD